MAVKKIVSLNQHQNPATNENQFDVENYLNANWNNIIDVVDNNADELTTAQNDIKSLQTDNTTNKDDIENLKSDNTKNKSDIEELQKDNTTNKQDIIALQEENKRLKEDLKGFPSGTATGENITLNDSADSRFNQFRIIGKSTQKTRSGKNIFNIDGDLQASGTIYEKINNSITGTKNTTTTTSRLTWSFICKPNTDYILTLDVTVIEDTIANASSNSVGIRTGRGSGSWLNGMKSITKNIGVKQSIEYEFNSANYSTLYLWLYLNTNAGDGKVQDKYENIMIREASEDDSYEEYGQMPSPQFPSNIRNVGDNINRFNKSTIKAGYYLDNTGAEIANNNYAITDYIEVEENENYVYQGLNILSSYASKGAYYNSNKEFINYFDLNSVDTIILIPKNVKYVRFTLRISNNNQDTFKFEKGTIATSYTPYNCGNINLINCNENLFLNGFATQKDSNFWTSISSYYTPLKDGWGKFSYNNTTSSTKYIEAYTNINFWKNIIKLNTEYTVIVEWQNANLNNNDNFTLLDNNGYSIFAGSLTITSNDGQSGTKIQKFMTRNSLENIRYLFRSFLVVGTGDTASIELRISLIEGDSIETSVSVDNQQYVFPLQEGQVLREGDYPSDDGIHHTRKQVELDGTEDWSKNDVSSETQIKTISFGINISNPINSTNFITCIANYFTGYITNEIYNKDKEGIWINSNRLYVRINRDMLETEDVEGFKKWLSENNLVVEYELAEEEIEPFTEGQQKVYNEIVNTAKTYKTVTNIFSTNEVSPVFEVNYRKDIETMINNVNKAVLSNA